MNKLLPIALSLVASWNAFAHWTNHHETPPKYHTHTSDGIAYHIAYPEEKAAQYAAPLQQLIANVSESLHCTWLIIDPKNSAPFNKILVSTWTPQSWIDVDVKKRNDYIDTTLDDVFAIWTKELTKHWIDQENFIHFVNYNIKPIANSIYAIIESKWSECK